MLSKPINILVICCRNKKLTQESTLPLVLYSGVYGNKGNKEKKLGLFKGLIQIVTERKEDQTLDLGSLQL